MKYLINMLLLLLIVVGLSIPAFAEPTKKNSDSSNVPEQDGDYPDPDHPGLRVRVFVHGPKGNHRQAPVVPACTDSDSTALVHSAGWKLPSGTWTYNLNPSSAPASIGGNLTSIAGAGFTTWSNALSTTSADPSFLRGGDTLTSRSAYDNKNIIAWGRTSGTALAVTYIRYYSSNGIVVDVDTIFNRKFPWSWTTNASCGDPNSYDAQAILTHELGHWLGLDDEYAAAYQNNTMYGYGTKGDLKADTLTQGDINGANAIY